MDPVTIGMLGSAAIGGLSSILGQNKQAKLAKQQMATNTALSNRQQDLAEQNARMGRAGTIDELGNQLIYDPVSNTWKTTLSKTGQQISDANTGEQLRELQYDAPMARGEAIANAGERSKDRDVAGSLRQQLQDQVSGRTAVSGNQLAGALSYGRGLAATAGERQATRAFNTNAMRTGMGAGAAADALATAGQQFSDQRAQAMGNPLVEGMQMADQTNQQRRGSLVDAYSALASRAAGGGNVQYTPSNQSSSLASTLATSKQAAASGGNSAIAGLNGAANTSNANTNLIGAAVPNYNSSFNGLTDIMSTMAGNLKKRSANTQPYTADTVNMNVGSNSFRDSAPTNYSGLFGGA